MSSIVRSSYSSRQTRTVGGVTRTEEKKVLETKSEKGGRRKEEQTVTIKKGGSEISTDKVTKDQKVPGIGSRFGQKALKDANGNTIEVKLQKDTSKKSDAKDGTKGADGVVDLKAEAARRRQKTTMSIEQRMMEQRQRKAADQKKRIQGRNAFKAQLEANAPVRSGPKKASFRSNADSNIDRLLRWTQNLTNSYPGVEVTDFSASWADGLALCALLNSLCPGEFPLDQMLEDDRKVNLDVAFNFAEEKGVPPLLETEDLLRSKTPEPKSMITYLHTIYKVLVADKAEQEKKEKEEEDEDKKDEDDTK